MAAAHARQSILNHLHHGNKPHPPRSSESRRFPKLGTDKAASMAQKETEKQFIAQWDPNSEPPSPSELSRVSSTSSQKNVGRSSKYLKCEDFKLIKTLGTGTFARVWLARLASTKNGADRDKVFALKILRKADVVRLKQVEHVKNERNVLAAVAGHPFITTLVTTFQDADSLYMILDYCPGGEVFSYLRRARRFNEETSLFYAAEIYLILEYLHDTEHVAYRDLKPENILVDADGHLKLVDFGFAKCLNGKETYTLCGTPEYLAPEIIKNSGHGTAVDWWAFGILIYEFLVGQPPFWDQSPLRIYEQIVEGKLRYPQAMSETSKDLIDKLCVVEPSKRLGNMKGGSADVKNHPWFEGTNWDELYYRRVKGPIIPYLDGPTDTSNFEDYDCEPEKRHSYTTEMRKKCDMMFKEF